MGEDGGEEAGRGREGQGVAESEVLECLPFLDGILVKSYSVHSF